MPSVRDSSKFFTVHFVLIYFSGSEVSDLGLHCQQRETLKTILIFPQWLLISKKILVHFYSHIF